MPHLLPTSSLVMFFLAFGTLSPTFGKDSRELKVSAERVLYVPNQNKLLAWGVAASRDNRVIAVIHGMDGKILGATDRERVSFGGFSPDGTTFVTLAKYNVELWNSATAKRRRDWTELHSASSVAFSSDAKVLAVVGRIHDFGNPRFLKAFDIQTGKELWSLPLDETVQLNTVQNGGLLAAERRGWRLLEFQTGKPLKAFDAGKDAGFMTGSIQFTKDVARFVHVIPNGCVVWDVQGRREVLAVNEPSNCVSKFVRGDNDAADMLVIGTAIGVVKSVNLDKLNTAVFAERHQAKIHAIDASESRRIAVTGGEDFRIKVWDLATGLLVKKFVGDKAPVTSVSIATDGDRVASTCPGVQVRIWNLK